MTMAGSKDDLTDQLAGNYAYRFSGYAMQTSIRWYLVGVGVLTIKRGGVISKGHHQFSLTALEGQRAHLITGTYTAQGKIKVNGEGSGYATISFRATPRSKLDDDRDGEDLLKGRNVDGTFSVQAAGSLDRLWLVSTKTTLPDENDKPTDELVTMEAVRMGF
jgi:hypothetical protein